LVRITAIVDAAGGGGKFCGMVRTMPRRRASLVWSRTALALAFAPALALAACHGPGAGAAVADPGETVRAWRAAVEKDDPHAAYELLSPRVRKDVPYATFARQWQETKHERGRQASDMSSAPSEGDGVAATADVALADGKKTRLVREKHFWRLEQPLLTSSRASTPQEAMRLFATALEDRNFFAVMRLLTSTRKDGMQTFLDGFVNGLRSNVGREITINNDRAVIEWKEGAKTWKVTLKKEDGEWRVDDVDW
jgi:hypothetical protein